MDSKGAKDCESDRSRQELPYDDDYEIVKFGLRRAEGPNVIACSLACFDTAENKSSLKFANR